MAKIREMKKERIVFLKKPFGKFPSGWCIVKAIDLRDKTATIWFVGQDFVEKYATIPFRQFRVATDEEALTYLTYVFGFDALTAVVVAHENNRTESLVQSLMQIGFTKTKAEDMPSLQSAMRILEDPTLFQQFLNMFDTPKTILSESEVS